jgi:hypothetical protein
MLMAAQGLSDERAARFMVALRDGTTPHIFGVNTKSLDLYFAARPEYARQARPLMEANAKAAYLRKGAHIREKTHCVNGHSFAEHGRVAMHKGWLTRQCRACELMRSRRGDKIRPEVLAKVTLALKSGLTVAAITKSGRPTRLVKHNALARYRRENPEFDRFVLDHSKDSIRRGQLLWRQRLRNEATRQERNDYHRIRSMLPVGFPEGRSRRR